MSGQRVKRAMVAVLAAAGLLLAGGCEAGPSSSGAQGTVIKREQKEARNSPKINYRITVREDSGKKDTGYVSKKVYRACQVGERWPACKKGAK